MLGTDEGAADSDIDESFGDLTLVDAMVVTLTNGEALMGQGRWCRD